MKQLMLAAAGLGSVIGVGFLLSRPPAPAVPPAEIATESASAPALARPEIVKAVAATPERPGLVDAPAPAAVLPASAAAKGVKLVFDQALETLVSPQTGYEQRQEVWQQLKRAGKLDQAISELEQRVAGNPQSLESVTSLGEGYYKKAAQTEDVRERAIYAMKADQTLEAALNLDPSSWEARFTKTVGMSRWPAELNKGLPRSAPSTGLPPWRHRWTRD